MKSTLKIFLVIALFSSITLAEGDMGNGGLTDGDMGNGGRLCTQNCSSADETAKIRQEQDINGFMEYVQSYLAKLFG